MMYRNIRAWEWPILLLSFVLAVCSMSSVYAADSKPVVAISVGGYDAIWKAVDSIADRMGYKSNVVGFRSVVADVQGLDKTKPGGVVVLTNGKELFPFGFLPVKKFDDLMFVGVESFRQMIEDVNGTKIMRFNNKPGEAEIELLERDGWLFFFEKGKAKCLPAGDPARFVDGLDQKYFLGCKCWCENMSPDLLDSLFSLARQRMAEPAATSAVDWQMLRKLGDTFITSVQSFVVGSRTDAAGGLVVESDSLLKSGSELASIYQNGGREKSLWAHIYQPNDAVFSGLVCARQAKNNQEYQEANVRNTFKNMFTSLKESLDEADLAKAEKVLVPFQEMLSSTASQEKLDGAITITADPLIVIGQTVVHGEKMVDFLKLLDKEVLTEEPLKGRLKIAAEKIGKYAISSFVFPFKELEEKASEKAAVSGIPPMFSGRDVAVYLGTCQDAVICVCGLDQKAAYEKIKSLASRETSKQEVSAQEYYLSLKEVGVLLKNLKLDKLSDTSKNNASDYTFIIDILAKADSKANISGKVLPTSKLSLAENFYIDGSVFALAGDIVRGFTKQNDKHQEGKKKDDLKESDSLFDH
ncbi:MAG: hypothetical protein PHQ75_12260 [Thermoguttaceae bacterium]|nr:hypothetical protein [Thermoguttaceae bacterium]